MKQMRFFLMMALGAMFGQGALAQTFSTELSAEVQKGEERVEVAPQLKGILELPMGEKWAMELELASAQAGLDFRADAKRALGSVLSIVFGASTGDGCQVFSADLGLGAAWEKWETAAAFYYAPFSAGQEKSLELTVQRNIGSVYLQPGVIFGHADREFSVSAVLTVGISLGI